MSEQVAPALAPDSADSYDFSTNSATVAQGSEDPAGVREVRTLIKTRDT